MKGKSLAVVAALALGVMLMSDAKASAQYVVRQGSYYSVSPGWGYGGGWGGGYYGRPVYGYPGWGGGYYGRPVYGYPGWGGGWGGGYGGGWGGGWGGGFPGYGYGGWGGRPSFGLSFNFIR